MVKDDAACPRPGADGRFDITRFTDAQHLAARDAGKDGRVGDAKDEDNVDQAAAQDGGDDDYEQEVGEGQHQVDNRHNDRVHPPAYVAGDGPKDHSQTGCDQHTEKANRQRDPGTIDEAAEQVAAQVVGAQGVFPTAFGAPNRRHLGCAQVLFQRIIGGNERGEKCRKDHHQEHQQADEAAAVAPQQPPDVEQAIPERLLDVQHTVHGWGDFTSGHSGSSDQ